MTRPSRLGEALQDACWMIGLALVFGAVAWSLTLHLQARFERKELMSLYASEHASMDALLREHEWLQATLEMARSVERITMESARELGYRPPRPEQRIQLGGEP